MIDFGNLIIFRAHENRSAPIPDPTGTYRRHFLRLKVAD